MENMLTPTHLYYTQDYLTQGLYSLIKPAEQFMPFPTKTHSHVFMAKPGNKTVPPPWHDPYTYGFVLVVLLDSKSFLLFIHVIISFMVNFQALGQSYCNSVEDRAPVDEIYWCPIFKWVAIGLPLCQWSNLDGYEWNSQVPTGFAPDIFKMES